MLPPMPPGRDGAERVDGGRGMARRGAAPMLLALLLTSLMMPAGTIAQGAEHDPPCARGRSLRPALTT